MHIARHSSVDQVAHLMTINSKSFYVEISEHGGSDSSNVVGLDANGFYLFKKNFYYDIYNSITQLIPTKDKALALIAYSDRCDVFGNEKNILVKLDTSGNILFQSFVPGLNYNRLRSITQHSDSSYYMVWDSLLFHYAKNGPFISKINTGLGAISQIKALNNGNLLVNATLNSTRKHVEITPSASIVTQQASSGIVSNYQQRADNTIFALYNNGCLEKLNTNLSVAATSTVTLNSNVILRAFIVRGDSILVTGYTTPSNTPVYMILDNNLSPLFQTSAPSYKNVYPSGISLLKNRVNIIANCTSSLITNISYNNFFQFPIAGTFKSSPDVGVTNVSAITSNPPYYNFNVIVKNFSSDAVNSFYLNCNYAPFACGSYQYHALIYASLAPGATISVPTGTFFSQYMNGEVCFFTTAPNFKADSEISNDGYCAIPVSVPINQGETEELRIYPNPFTSTIRIASSSVVRNIAIYNQLGLLTKQIDVQNNDLDLNLSELPSGLYVVKCETEEGIQMEKIIKDQR